MPGTAPGHDWSLGLAHEVNVAEQYPWKLAWITGASGAICGEIARRLAAEGVTVAASGQPSERLYALPSQ